MDPQCSSLTSFHKTMARRTNNSRTGNHYKWRRLDSNDANHSWGPWAELPEDIILTILMMLGVIDYLSFSGVCKSWRLLALSNREAFFTRKEPLRITLLKKINSSKRACILHDIFDKERRYKTLLPGTSRGFLLGVSCGYLILLTRRHKLSAVNPITRHQLSFPGLQKTEYFTFGFPRAVLVYSSLLSKFIIVVLFRKDNHVRFSGSGDSQWVVLPDLGNDWEHIVDLTFFMGKIYILNCEGSIGEIRLSLNPMNSLQFHDMKSWSLQEVSSSSKDVGSYNARYTVQLVTSRSQLFMVDFFNKNVLELDFEKMEWVLREDLGEEIVFLSRSGSSSIVTSTNWQGRGTAHYKRIYFLDQREDCAWYFPHECYARNVLNDCFDFKCFL